MMNPTATTTPLNPIPACRNTGGRRTLYWAVLAALICFALKYAVETGILGDIGERIKAVMPAAAEPQTTPPAVTTMEKAKLMMIQMGVQIYGSDQCPWSRKQLADLDIDPSDDRLFVDCDKHPSKAKNIEAYPTWRLRDADKPGYMPADTAVEFLQSKLYSKYNEPAPKPQPLGKKAKQPAPPAVRAAPVPIKVEEVAGATEEDEPLPPPISPDRTKKRFAQKRTLDLSVPAAPSVEDVSGAIAAGVEEAIAEIEIGGDDGANGDDGDDTTDVD